MQLGHPGRRARILFAAMLFIFSLFAVQIVRVQGVDAAAVSAKAKDSRLRKQNVDALRGQIVDRNGTVLASSVQRYNVTADATQTAQFTRVVKGQPTVVIGNSGVAAGLASVVGGNAKDYYAILQAGTKRKSKFNYLVKNVTPQQWQRIAALNLAGISRESAQERQYPQGASAASIVGWVGGDKATGAGGIELMRQQALNGRPGVTTSEDTPGGTVIATGNNSDTPAVNGSNIKLTLDSDLQFYASNALAAQVKKTGAEAGDLVVMDRHGNVLSAVSYPSFDPAKLGADPTNLQSRPFAEAYEPGSTSKVITMSAALSDGVTTPTSQVVVPSVLRRAGTTFHDSEAHGVENLTVAGVLAKSSNMGTMMVGEKISSNSLYSYMTKFGLGSKTGTQFPGETSGIVANPSQWSGSQRYTVMFGQGLSTSLIQQASVYQTIANDGVRLPVTMIAGVQQPSGDWIKPTNTRKPVQVVSPTVASEVRRMLSGVVGEKGTAPKANVAGYNVAGKTGTANLYDSKLGKYNGYTASFIGMAPAEDPKYIIAVALQRPKTTIYGGEAAAPVFSQVMGYLLRARGQAPSKSPVQVYPIQYATPATTKRPG